MKKIILLLVAVVTLSSCGLNRDYTEEVPVSLNEVLSSHDIWYVDYNSKTGKGDVPFLSIAFTISFLNGQVYANNNLVGIGRTGNGYGVLIGTYNTSNTMLSVNHPKYGRYEMEVIQLSEDKIRLVDRLANATYDLEGYHKQYFNFDGVFYDNIEYFLQEYVAWEKNYTSQEGMENPFDSETFLGFTSENNTTFYSSKDEVGTNVDIIKWDYTGSYEVADIEGISDLKMLTLFYDNNEREEFELSVLDDANIQLYHISSKTTYRFSGIRNLLFKRKGSVSKEKKRFKTYRKTVKRKI